MKFRPILKRYKARSDYKKVDLSAKTLNKKSIDISDHKALINYLEEIKSRKHAKVLYGGYLEKRSLYNKKSLFKKDSHQRNIHLGTDFWANAGEEIIAPKDGVVHSFKDNSGFGNYGPCIILEHEEQNEFFYTLYGHLSRNSLIDLKVGDKIMHGQAFCELGNPEENGGYVPHLHFQIIKDIQDHKGDYPGVCSEADLEFYNNNTLNPEDFLDLLI